jgi:hypothetical protein
VGNRARICIIGRITKQELGTPLSKSDVWNGLVNRFLWVAVRCSMFVSSQRHRRFAVPPIDASLLPL